MATETAQETAKSTSTRSQMLRAHRTKAKKPRTAATKKAASRTPRRKQTTPAERAKILAAADRDGLTAKQVQKRFGVVPVTYYSWRKKLGMKGRRGRKPAKSFGPGGSAGMLAGLDVAGQIRQTLRAQIARMLPELIQAEVAAAIGGAVAGRRGKR